jgi:hypothetical protein
MRKKSFEQIVRPDDPEAERRGAHTAMNHALDMAGRGHFSQAELRDLQRLFAQKYRDTLPDDEYDQRTKDGTFDQLQDLCGYGDDEDEDEVDARCHHLGVQVIAHFFASAAQSGLIEPQQALEEIAKYAALPQGDAGDVVGAILDALNSGQRLPLAGDEAGQRGTDEEVDQALSRLTDRRGRPLMRAPRGAKGSGLTNEEVEAFLDAATDHRGKPLFPPGE